MFYWHNFLYIDPLGGCFISITPSFEFNNTKVKQGIAVLKNALPDEYAKMCHRINSIDPNVACGGFEGGCFEPGRPNTIYVNPTFTNLAWTANVLVHETCHAYQFSEKRDMSEAECYQKGDQVLQKLVVL